VTAADISNRGPIHTTGFLEELLRARHPLITEVKCRSAHGRDLLAGRTVANIVERYQAIDTPCMSVVTGEWFGGTPELLTTVRRETDRPLLVKDFITRRGQLERFRTQGADAVLLTLAILSAPSAARLVEQTLELGMTPFVEVSSADEAAGVPLARSCVVAVNNRDIASREAQGAGPERSHDLLDVVQRTGTRCPVSASGIEAPSLARELMCAGYEGLLVGTALMNAEGLDEWLDATDRRR
jgi:indole-3-glycerol phosphate synthase